MLSIKEVHFYNDLVNKGIVKKINCPFEEDEHIVISITNESDEVLFECLTCNTIFKPGINTEQIIKSAIEKHKNPL